MKPQSVDDYIKGFSGDVRHRLECMRTTIMENAPEATERISYGMPGYFQDGALVYFAAFAKHIGFYATPTGHKKFEKALSVYKQGKGSVQFPHEEPLPLDLVAEIVRFRLSENSNRIQTKSTK